MCIKRVDYIDINGDLRVARTTNPRLWKRKVDQIIGRRMAWGERYESVGGARTWSEAIKTYELDD